MHIYTYFNTFCSKFYALKSLMALYFITPAIPTFLFISSIYL
nr:MAG TPA: hypothetical protein [Siphoviridae sp. ctuK76]